jgi:hypothetical protein
MPMLGNATSDGLRVRLARGELRRDRAREERAMEPNTSPSGLTKPPEEQHSGAERLLQLVSFKIGNGRVWPGHPVRSGNHSPAGPYARS